MRPGPNGHSRYYPRLVTSPTPLPDPRVRQRDADAQVPSAARPGTGGLVDRHGRVATDLRVSLTDRCNLRCSYCMPPEGLQWLPKAEVLTDDELARLHSPIGLDLGARTPEETAVSIAAEVVALRWGGAGTRLAERPGRIHAPGPAPRLTE